MYPRMTSSSSIKTWVKLSTASSSFVSTLPWSHQKSVRLTQWLQFLQSVNSNLSTTVAGWVITHNERGFFPVKDERVPLLWIWVSCRLPGPCGLPTLGHLEVLLYLDAAIGALMGWVQLCPSRARWAAAWLLQDLSLWQCFSLLPVLAFTASSAHAGSTLLEVFSEEKGTMAAPGSYTCFSKSFLIIPLS